MERSRRERYEIPKPDLQESDSPEEFKQKLREYFVEITLNELPQFSPEDFGLELEEIPNENENSE